MEIMQDQTLFLNAIERNKDRLFRICRTYAIDTDDSKDLYQEVVLNIWKSFNSFKGESSIDTWIIRIGLNICLRAKEYSSKAQKRVIKLESIKYENIAEENNDGNENQLKRLYACISKLEGVDKSVIVLYLEEQPYKDISVILGISENNVAVRVKRIKSKLLTCLKSELC